MESNVLNKNKTLNNITIKKEYEEYLCQLFSLVVNKNEILGSIFLYKTKPFDISYSTFIESKIECLRIIKQFLSKV